jgi:hypothetical protein
MKNKQLLSIICIAVILAITLTACTESDPNAPDRTTQTTAEVTAPTVPSEPTEPTVDVQANRTAAPVVTTAPTEVQEMRLNTEFLEEFGMTLSELEERHGNAVRGEVEQTGLSDGVTPYNFYTYFFEGFGRGYTFLALADNAQRDTISDGTARVGEESIFFNFQGQVKDFFLGMENSMTVEEFEKTYGGKFSFITYDLEDEYIYQSSFWFDDHDIHYNFSIRFKEREIIELDSRLSIQFKFDESGW